MSVLISLKYRLNVSKFILKGQKYLWFLITLGFYLSYSESAIFIFDIRYLTVGMVMSLKDLSQNGSSVNTEASVGILSLIVTVKIAQIFSKDLWV
jgi:hypothetical protein